MVKTWRDIPIKDIGPMLEECKDTEAWRDLWPTVPIRIEGSLTEAGARALMVYLVTVCVAAGKHDKGNSLTPDNLIDTCLFDDIFKDTKNKQYETYGCNKYLQYIAKECRQQIISFIWALKTEKIVTLGPLMKWLVEEKNKEYLSKNEQQNLEPARKQLVAELDKFYKIWDHWLRKKIEVISVGNKALEHLEHGVEQIIFNGAPGTGKSYVSELLARYLGSILPGEKNPYVRVQFHPSYDYTDFVEGLRPVMQADEGESGEGGSGKRKKTLSYVKLDGTFKAFCRKVVKENKKLGNKDNNYFFLIDEINRADLSKVFGELMYCLESDKRGPEHAVLTQYQNLRTYSFDSKKKEAEIIEDDCFADGFYIPENVYIIGTMNDIDRSVESMDFALRRRFHFIEIIMPDLAHEEKDEKQDDESKKRLKALKEQNEDRLKALINALNAMESTKQHAETLAKCIQRLNDKIRAKGAAYNLNRHYYISQGQFPNLPTHLTKLDDIKDHVWKYRIEPLLREYLRGENEKEIEGFVGACNVAFFNEDNNK